MSAHSSRFLVRAVPAFCIAFVSGTALFAGDLVLQKVPALTVTQAPSYPENVARYRVGAQLEVAPQSNPIASLQLSSNSEDNNIAEAALLCDDPTVGYFVSNGKITLIVSLSRIENLESIAFRNNGAKGEMSIAISSMKLSPGSAQWREVSHQELTSDIVNAKVGPTDAKYLKVTLNVTEPGRISGFGVYSTPTMADFTAPRAHRPVQNTSENFELISCNVTDVHAKGRAVYVTSGSDPTDANKMIDDQLATSYAFAADDASPAAIIDLGKQTTIQRISAVYAAREGMIDFYVLRELPLSGSKGLPKSIKLNDADLRPVGSVADKGAGRAAVDFPAVTGRYILVKWNPAVRNGSAPFAISEIAAFSSRPSSTAMMAANLAATMAYQSDGKDAKDLGGGKEAKEMPEEGPPAEGPPPNLPDPPPFVFVPELVPTSP